MRRNRVRRREYTWAGEGDTSLDDELISIHTFNYRHEAELAKGMLDANGIYAVVFSDDAGSQEVSLQFVRGAKLLVKQQDENRAKAVLSLR